ncbi:ABC transporter ATP-binding protein [Kribbia dieselivorans]|uniref:ABC transporter ATP-binding protein n=1 Tax=Kribbia dieselivorans TaxID=331526 RepID=UPI0009F8AF6C|nr:ABC transporter ATP-binding protein [Kribbia dieselivorans]
MTPTPTPVPETSVSPTAVPPVAAPDTVVTTIFPAAPRTKALYDLSGVTRTYRRGPHDITPLDGVDLTLEAGEFVTIQGPTGGGKSTLLQLLGALDRPTAGTIRFGDVDLSSASDAQLTKVRSTRIGFVFQQFNLIPTLTAHENVDVALESRGLSRADRRERVGEALRKVGLADRAGHRQGELSGGQQQRVAIARAIVASPEVLLADEPTGNLDEAMRDEILDLLQQLNADGLTIVAVTHDSAVATRADRRLRLDGGKVHVDAS